MYAMDCFTVDTIFNKRYYVFFIIAHKSREIVQFAVTQNPTAIFLKQQFMEFEQTFKGTIYLIHDREATFMSIDYLSYGIKDVATSVKAPNMNSIAERFVRSARNESLDNFIIFRQKQIVNILSEYVKYYNTMRPHQGIDSIPRGIPPDVEVSDFSTKNVKSEPVLSGLHHHYWRDSA